MPFRISYCGGDLQAYAKTPFHSKEGAFCHESLGSRIQENQRNRFHHLFLLRTRVRVNLEENGTDAAAEEGVEAAFSGAPDNSIRSSSCVTPSLSIIVNAPLIKVFSKL